MSHCSGEFWFEKLLTLIDEGKLALLRAPPIGHDAVRPAHERDPTVEWMEWTLALPSLDPKGTLAECIKLLDDRFPRTSGKELQIKVEQEVLHDMCQMQLQPAIMDNHRRFVAIVEARNDTIEVDGVSDTQPLYTYLLTSRHCRSS